MYDKQKYLIALYFQIKAIKYLNFSSLWKIGLFLFMFL